MPNPLNDRSTVTTSQKVSAPELLREMQDAAQRAGVSQVALRPDDSVRYTIPQRALAQRRINMRALELPMLDSRGPNFGAFLPSGEQSHKASRFSDAVLASSRVLGAGAGLLLVKDAPEPQQSRDGLIVMSRTESGYTVIEPTTLALLADGADLDTDGSAPQVFRAMVDLENDFPTYAVRVKLSRADQKKWFEGELANNVLWSIALGVARAVDAIALAAILDTTPTEFSLAAAAARNLRAGELTALVGTDGTAAAWRQDGVLTAAGVVAELTPDTESTIVGAFNRMAVAVHEDLAVIVERRDLEGAMELTVLVNAAALIPDTGSSAFWTVSAAE